MRTYLFLLLCGFALPSIAQNRYLKSAAQHSHNDYAQPVPFFTAYQHKFESVEADIFFVDGQILVAHDSTELKRGRPLADLYLTPLANAINANNGFVYPEKEQTLQLLIDIKSEAYSTLQALIMQLNRYPEIIQCSTLTIVISGHRPKEADFSRFPAYIYFDGIPGKTYTKAALKKVALISDNFQQYSKWKGQGELPPHEKARLIKLIEKTHRLHKSFRFWGCPDVPSAWKEFVEMGVDFINTDHIEALSSFLQNASSKNKTAKD